MEKMLGVREVPKKKEHVELAWAKWCKNKRKARGILVYIYKEYVINAWCHGSGFVMLYILIHSPYLLNFVTLSYLNWRAIFSDTGNGKKL